MSATSPQSDPPRAEVHKTQPAAQPLPLKKRLADEVDDLAELVLHGAGHDREAIEAARLAKEKQEAIAAQDPAADSTAGQEETGFWPVLQNRNFLALWSGQVFSQLADKVYLIAAISIVAARFQEPGQAISGWVSAITIAFTIPAVLFGSLAGIYVDRWQKQTVLVVTNVVRGLLVLALPLVLALTAGGPEVMGIPIGFGALLAMTFCVSTLTQYFAPAEQATIPLIVQPQHLLSANSLYTTTMMASTIVGFAVGEPLLAIANQLVAGWGWGADLGQELAIGGSYAIAGGLLLWMKTGESPTDHTIERPHVLQDLRDGLRYLLERPLIRNALIQLTILFSIFAALAVLAVRIAEVIPGMKASQFGLLLAAGSAGLGLGALLLGQFGSQWPYQRSALLGSVGMGAALVGLASATASLNLWAAVTAIVSLGAAAAFVGIPMQTTIQRETPEEMRGKVFGLQNNAVNVALSLPLALSSVAESYWGLPTVLLLLAVLAIAGGGATWYISVTSSARST